jgi:hypothetical protein
VIKSENFEWDNLKYLAEIIKDEEKIEGISKNQWIEWLLIDKPNLEICKELGREVKDSHSASSTIARILDSEFGLSKREAVKKYRILKFIGRRMEGKSLKEICVNDFGLNEEALSDWHLRRFYERLFDNKLTYEEIESMGPYKLLNLKSKITNT